VSSLHRAFLRFLPFPDLAVGKGAEPDVLRCGFGFQLSFHARNSRLIAFLGSLQGFPKISMTSLANKAWDSCTVFRLIDHPVEYFVLGFSAAGS